MKYSAHFRYLGAVLLIQLAISLTAMVTGLQVEEQFLSSGHTAQSMISMAHDPFWIRANIIGELLTAIGYILVGVLVYSIFRYKEKFLASAVLALYICGSTLLAGSFMSFMSSRVSIFQKKRQLPSDGQ